MSLNGSESPCYLLSRSPFEGSPSKSSKVDEGRKTQTSLTLKTILILVVAVSDH